MGHARLPEGHGQPREEPSDSFGSGEVSRHDDCRRGDSDIAPGIAVGHAQVKELTPRGTHQTLETTLEQINKWYVGWSNYFGMTYYPAQLHKIEAHIRRRLRSRLVDQ
jgi:hypothetical protein